MGDKNRVRNDHTNRCERGDVAIVNIALFRLSLGLARFTCYFYLLERLTSSVAETSSISASTISAHCCSVGMFAAGEAAMMRPAVAVPPLPPCTEVTAPVTLFCGPEPVAVTFTVN